MQWWCSAQNAPWTWQWRPYPGVWLFIALIGCLIWMWNRAGARRAGRRDAPLHPAAVAGLFVLWLALDWPIGALGAGYLASVHMLQFQLIALVAAPFLLRGVTPDALSLLRGSPLYETVRRLTAPAAALIALNAVVLLTHIPAIVDALMATQGGSFAIDVLWLIGGLLFWWPVVLAEPAHPRFVPALKIGYVILGLMFSPVMFGIAGFLVYSQHPLFATYELAPPVPGLSSKSDHVVAGLLMSVGGALVAFVAMTKIFFDWSKNEG
ncbi:MAG TPA: cytochrome c oxidase assembly protein [Gemmatimonadaceae bacterium]|nr:cytochrome c oxidase assembly protein [Gemmatimonadaceae bacterium]